MPEPTEKLTVAVTGPTGTFGFGLIPRLEADERIGRIVGIARRPFDPAEHGWSKLDYRRGDVRDQDALAEAFAGSDVVVHLAFIIVGRGSRETIREVNVEGTLNAVRAAAEAGAKRFVYASSVAAYGFHRDNPYGMTEEWPARPADHLFYAQEKAEIEHALAEETAAENLDLYLLRPPIVLGPNAMGAKDLMPERAGNLGAAALRKLRGSRVRLPVPVPDLPVQFIHEDDVGQAFHLCIVAAGPPGTYNITGDGVLSARDLARELGLQPLPVPAGPVRAGARALAALPFAPPVLEWAEALSQPPIMDASKAKEELGWEPEYDSLAALRATLPAD
ncbi:MAG TPA: NAD-dependent epimerase/dehydratase family protein [Solirubrobacterales bacterium]|nr:NAD-dependent epimerase/dehydratase family protein [Solirubrobacterales bacterium]